MWYKNIAGRFFGLVTKHACDGRTDGQTGERTDRITTPKTALKHSWRGKNRAAECYAMGASLPAGTTWTLVTPL